MKSKRSKACDISKTVKDRVWERDKQRCIICGNSQAMPNAHYIPRSQGGLGIEENIITLCQNCHFSYDNTSQREGYRRLIKSYLMITYGEQWSEENLIYKKGEIYEKRK